MERELSADEISAEIIKSAELAGFEVVPPDELEAMMREVTQAATARDDRFRAEGRIFLAEENDRAIIDTWYTLAEKAETVTDLETLHQLLTKTYRHDYGTICHAVAASALAAAHVMDRDNEQGGITGFQASAVMWEFVGHWLGNRGPMVMRRWEDALYPQNEPRFAHVMSPDVWAWLQAEATQLLAGAKSTAHPNVVAHWQSIVDGTVPFGMTVAESDE